MKYILGSEEAEIARLEQQAEQLAPPTRILLGAAGIAPGMRVLDLGTGLGHVALELAQRVGPTGEVVGVDQAAGLLERAERRRAAAGVENVRFLEGDARRYRDAEPFDAIVARLLLFHLPDAADVVRHHLAALVPGGVFLALDFDLGTARAEPEIELVTRVRAWIEQAFVHASADPRIGAHLPRVLREAGCADVTTLGVQAYLAWDDPRGPALLAGVTRTLAPTIRALGIADEAELDPATLERRIAQAIDAAGAVLLLPGLVGAWGRAS